MSRFGSGLLGGLLLAAVVLGLAAPAHAHALRQSSVPEAGAALAASPVNVSVTFGEEPDPELSSIHVLDTAGRDHSRGRTDSVAGQALTLRVDVAPLANGVYTVAWRTVSHVDGHLATGTFAFGVGVAPTGTAAASPSAGAPSPTIAAVGARWALYAGSMLVVGGAFVGLACLRGFARRVADLLVVGSSVALGGVIGVVLAQARVAGVAVSDLAGSFLGAQLLRRGLPIVLALMLAVSALVVHVNAARWVLIGLAGVSGVAAMWADVAASHVAAAASWRWLRMALQCAHFAAAGVWIGGLAVLLATIGAVPRDGRAAVARRYSALALVAFAVVGGTGLQRAIDEVGSVAALRSTAFGQEVLIKSGLLAVLLALGGVNRYRSVPKAAESLKLLRTFGRSEIFIAAVVLAATGVLQGLAPPAGTAVAAGVPAQVVDGHDAGTTMRARLSISPGRAGFNHFRLAIEDYDTHQPITGARATLRFKLASHSEIGESTLEMLSGSPGDLAADGANLSIDGSWAVTAIVQQPTASAEIPFSVTTRPADQKIDVSRTAGLPDIFTLHLPDGRVVQTYADPGRASVLNEVHVTLLGPDGTEPAVDAMQVYATDPATSTPQALTVRKLDTLGHYVADLPGPSAGVWTIDVTATVAAGDVVHGLFAVPVR